ncbi:unnamed protein product, partial [Choristocarpus tenellus]
CASLTVRALGSSIQTLLSTGVPSKDLEEIIGQDWVIWGGTTPPAPAPEVHILAAHDARTMRRAQHEIIRLLNRIHFDSFRTTGKGKLLTSPSTPPESVWTWGKWMDLNTT